MKDMAVPMLNMGVLAAPEERQDACALLMAAAQVGVATREQPAQVALLPAAPAALLAPRQEAAVAVAPYILAQDATVAVDATPAQDTTVAAQADSAHADY